MREASKAGLPLRSLSNRAKAAGRNLCQLRPDPPGAKPLDLTIRVFKGRLSFGGFGQSPILLSFERRALQCAVVLAGMVPISAGVAGVLLGVSLLATAAPGSDLDSHFRYLSGLLLAIGLAFWSRVPAIERHGTTFRLLGGIVVLGGLSRLVGVILAGPPSMPMLATFGMELGVTPLLCLWQGRIARHAAGERTSHLIATSERGCARQARV